MKKLAFISVLVMVIGICVTVIAFADFYVIPVGKKGCYATVTIVPKTGQVGCWNSNGDVILCLGTGQDGEYKVGHAQAVAAPSLSNPYTAPNWTGDRFTDNNDGTVTDNLTTLIWLEDANSLSGGTTDWATALNYCNDLETGGHTDWRLPNFNELRSLDDTSQSSPCLPSGHPFTNVQNSFYWTSTTSESNRSFAFHMNMIGGEMSGRIKSFNANVWPVRGGN